MCETFELITVNADNLDKQGFFCYLSKRKTPGYRQKHDWMAARLAEGLKLHMIHEIGGRTVGFIEYIPGEHAWRAVHAPSYLLIHCLWVVGKGKGKGYGAHLIQTCLDDARAQGKHGVVTVATDRVWMAKKDIFLKHGFVEVDQAPPTFHLLAYRFDDNFPLPAFPTDWEARQARFGAGLTDIRSPHCHYIEDAVNGVLQCAAEHNLPAKVSNCAGAEVQALSPSPGGCSASSMASCSHHYLLPKEFEKLFH